MPNLTIRFVDEPGIVSRLITWETDSLWCHTEGLSRDGKSWIGAHTGTGVQARPLDWCKPTREAIYALPVTDLQYAEAMMWMERKMGTPYNYADICGLALRIPAGATDHRLICSAFMSEWLMQAGLAPLNCLEGFAYRITPERLHLSPLLIGRRIPNAHA